MFINNQQVDQETLQTQLREIEAQLKHWKAQAEHIGADARVEYQRRLEDLERRRTEIKGKISEFENSDTSGAWHSVKETIDGAWDDLKETFDNATARFSES